MKRQTKAAKRTTPATETRKQETVKVLADAHLDQVHGGVMKPCCCQICH